MAVAGKRILITGGTGFLGRSLALQLRGANTVLLGARNHKQNQLAHHATGCEVVPLDVSSKSSLQDAVVAFRPDIIIHAAATKFVDLAERQPLECIDVNVRGSENVARVALERDIELVVGISTDKAAPPVRNTYGLTKALMERLFCSLDRPESTRFICVRYGNVAWSTGSVLPEWRRMLLHDGFVGSTGPDMRRFFFSVDEAVSLVLTAMQRPDISAGRVLSRRMKAALIRDLLDAWVEAHGGSWRQVDGRPGDRTDEYLIGELEVPFTSRIQLGNVDHYLISFNRLAEDPIGDVVSSANAERLTHVEMLDLVQSMPMDIGT